MQPQPGSFSLRAIALSLLLAALSSPASATASLLIWPVHPVIKADRTSGALWLENRGDTPAMMQVRVFKWSQAEGEDRFEQQHEVVASPPMIEIAPKTRQLVRLSTVMPTRPAGESAYRVIIDEIPVTEDEGVDTPGRRAIRFQMRYSVSLFVYGEKTGASEIAAKPSLHCSVVQDDSGRKKIEISNPSGIHARLQDVRLEGKDDIVLANGLLGYVLPRSVRSFPLPEGATGREAISMTVNGHASRVTIPACAGI